jgi:very-short-patch-repair endonuclease
MTNLTQDKMSTGEKIVAEILIKNNLEFIYQKVFNSCRNINLLPFDFYLPKYNLIIEYDGLHHTQPIYGLKKLKRIRKTDKLKNRFCKDNEIHIIRLSSPRTYKKESIILNKIHEITMN